MIKLLKKLFGKKVVPEEREVRLVPYAEANDMLEHGWTLAKEEDTNHQIGMVYLERRGGKDAGK